jgi:repressor LexA
MNEPRLTDNQRHVLDFIGHYLAHNERPPTLREIAAALGLASHSSAQDYVEALVRKGALERLPHHRGLRLVGGTHAPARPSAFELPLIGRVAAGSPILAEANVEARFALDPDLFRPRPHYLLRVAGSSMRDAGILDGDLIAVHRSDSADDGRIVVARVDGEVTVKRLRRTPERVLLLPANPDYAPIEVDPCHGDRFAIEGLYVGVIRRS